MIPDFQLIMRYVAASSLTDRQTDRQNDRQTHRMTPVTLRHMRRGLIIGQVQLGQLKSQVLKNPRQSKLDYLYLQLVNSVGENQNIAAMHLR